MILIGILVVLAILLWYHVIRPLNYFNRIGVKQTNPWPIFGDQWRLLFGRMTAYDLALWIYNLYPKTRYIGIFEFTKPALLIRDPELIKELTVKEFDHFTDHKSFGDSDIEPLWASNLFLLKGLKWREMRATLSGTFTSSKMKHMFETINDAAEMFVHFFLNKKEELIEVEMKDAFSRYSNDVIATAAFGLKVDSLSQPANTFYNTGKRLTTLTGFKMLIKSFIFMTMPKLFKALKIAMMDSDIINYFVKIIFDAIKTREKKGIIRKDMINLLMETRKGVKQETEQVIETGYATVKESLELDKYKIKKLKNLTDADIAAQALVFFFAGFDTISTVLSFGSYELAINPDVQSKLREEVKETQAANNGQLSYDSLLNMKYMDQVFSEILRKWPATNALDRVCTKPYTIQPKYKDEKPVQLNVGDIIFLPMFGLHRDPKYFPEPEKFNPERFSDENKEKIVPYSYIPFGSGPRSCIGSRFAILEAKAVLYHLLSNFEIVPVEKTSIPLTLKKGSFQVAAKNGFWLGLKPLKSTI